MAICELSHRFEKGPIRLGRRVGSEITPPSGLITVSKHVDLSGMASGFFAKVVSPDEVKLFEFGGVTYHETAHLIQGTVNKHPLTKHRFHWRP